MYSCKLKLPSFRIDALSKPMIKLIKQNREIESTMKKIFLDFILKLSLIKNISNRFNILKLKVQLKNKIIDINKFLFTIILHFPWFDIA